MKKLIIRTHFLFIIFIMLSVRLSTSPEQCIQLEHDQTQQVIQSLNNLYSYFAENKGQVNECVKYYLKIPNANVYFTEEEIVYQFLYRKDEENAQRGKVEKESKERSKEIKVNNIRLEFKGANEGVKIEGLEEKEAKVSYYRGNDPRNWVKGARIYGKVLYRELYPHIDLIVYETEGRIKHEYRVREGGEVEKIEVQYKGIERLWVNEIGQLEIETKEGVLKEDVPMSYQVVEGKRVDVKAKYQIEKDTTVRFEVGEYRKDNELIIDPPLIFSTYLGGSGGDYGYGIAVDDSGNPCVTGYTYSTDYPTTSGAYDTDHNGSDDIFITKLNSTGTGLLFSTYLGGSGDDYGNGITVDNNGNIYVTGKTGSSDFPTTSGAFDTDHNGSSDGFITKINSSGTGLIYSTFLGGSEDDYGNEITIDGNDNTYVIGDTGSSNFPTTLGAFDESFNGWLDAFITKINSSGTGLVYSTFLGGGNDDYGEGIAIYGGGIVYVAGRAGSSDFPTTSGAYDPSYNGTGDVFITKLNSTGTGLLYSTFLGGSGHEWGKGIVIDRSGIAYVTGYTLSSDFPTSLGAYDASYNGFRDVFIAKIDSSGQNLLYSTYLGGSGYDDGRGIAIDVIGNAYVTGWTEGFDFPTTIGAYSPSHNGGEDVFITKINSSGTALSYSTFLGGTAGDYIYGNGIALDENGNAIVTGETWSNDFPTTSGAYDRIFNGIMDVFTTKVTIPMQFPLFDGQDFNGDMASDISVFRPSNGVWYIKGQPSQGWGTSGDTPVNGDYNGDNITDIAVWRPSTGRWFVKGQAGTYWGTAGDIPVPGDYNGDGVTDYAVWRPSTGRWFVLGMTGTYWGTEGDIPVPGDYNGDGVTDYAVWRPSNGRWYIKGQTGIGWGQIGDIPVPGDYNGDGETDIAVWRPSTSRWFVLGMTGTYWGASGDIPVPGDYNADGVTDFATWRPSTGRWYIKDQAGAGWGALGDIPLVR